jgi:hypothetical protein
VGTSIIHLDPKSIGLDNANATEVLKDVANMNSKEDVNTSAAVHNEDNISTESK